MLVNKQLGSFNTFKLENYYSKTSNIKVLNKLL